MHRYEKQAPVVGLIFGPAFPISPAPVYSVALCPTAPDLSQSSRNRMLRWGRMSLLYSGVLEPLFLVAKTPNVGVDPKDKADDAFLKALATYINDNFPE